MGHVRKLPDITPERLGELFSYDPISAIIQNRKTRRKMLPDENGLVRAYDNDNKVEKKFLYRTLAWVLGSKQNVPEGFVVLAMDLDNNNIKFNNLKLIPKKDEVKIKLALRNLDGGLRIAPHKKDAHAYVLFWTERAGVQRQAVYYDIAAAEKAWRAKQLEYVKLINQYILSK